MIKNSCNDIKTGFTIMT